MTRAGGTALALPLAMLLACASPQTPVRRDAARDVLLITVDTLRADALGAYGNASVQTTWIDRLASNGVRFTNAHASTVVTLPSHANILSGAYPFRHGVRENAGFRFPEDRQTIATLLKARGYRTAAFVSAFPLDRRFGLTRGFDVYDDGYPKNETHTAFKVPERAAADTVAAAVAWMRADRARPDRAPQFVWVHVYEPHFPYAPPEPFASRYRAAPYLGEVSAVDAALAPLLSPILADGVRGSTLVVLTGDHGESLGEHGEMTHGLFAYEGTLRIPLVLYEPHLIGHRVVPDPVRHIDILPTILEAVGAPAAVDVDGRSILGLASGRAAEPAATYFESMSASINRGWAPLYGVERGSLKYIDLPIPELYDLAADPAEAHNLAQERPDEVRELQQLLALLRKDEGRQSSAVRETADTRARLRSLGYLAGGAAAKAHYTEADDPKQLVAIDRAIDEVVTRYQSGDVKGAIALGEDVVRRRPDMPLSLVHLAFLYNEAGDHRRAVAAIRRASALNPAAEDVAALAGAYLTEAGLPVEAVEHLKPFAERPDADVDVLIAYGVALDGAGRPRDSLAAFERARAADPTNPLPLVDIGMAHLMAGNIGQAAPAFDAALELDPNLARAHNGLGVIAARRRDYETALSHWRSAVAADPRDFQTLFNLGDLLAQLGRTDEAKSYWQRYLDTAPPGAEDRDRERVRRWLGSHR